eukprot:4390661-Prymnesium_polylepis.1
MRLRATGLREFRVSAVPCTVCVCGGWSLLCTSLSRCRNVVELVVVRLYPRCGISFGRKIRSERPGDAAEKAAHSDRQRKFEEAPREVQGRAGACAEAIAMSKSAGEISAA